MPKTRFYHRDKIARIPLSLHSGGSKYTMLNGVIDYRIVKAYHTLRRLLYIRPSHQFLDPLLLISHRLFDLLLIHSKKKTPDEIVAFTQAWPGTVPLTIVPTAYPDLTEAKARALGKIGIMIYANHAVRAAVTAMREVFAAIRRDGGIHQVDKRIASVEDIFDLQRVPAMKAAEKRYLR